MTIEKNLEWIVHMEQGAAKFQGVFCKYHYAMLLVKVVWFAELPSMSCLDCYLCGIVFTWGDDKSLWQDFVAAWSFHGDMISMAQAGIHEEAQLLPSKGVDIRLQW